MKRQTSNRKSPISSPARGGDPNLSPKRVNDSQVRLSLPMNPDLANALGNVHGGQIIRTFACHFERSEKSRFAQRDFSQNRSK